jgi:hypothetical protein
MKLLNSRPGETPEQRIVRCANNLLKAVVAAGYSLHETSGASGLEITAYDHLPNEIHIWNILSGWSVRGRASMKITFRPSDDELKEDEPRQESAEERG